MPLKRFNTPWPNDFWRLGGEFRHVRGLFVVVSCAPKAEEPAIVGRLIEPHNNSELRGPFGKVDMEVLLFLCRHGSSVLRRL